MHSVQINSWGFRVIWGSLELKMLSLPVRDSSAINALRVFFNFLPKQASILIDINLSQISITAIISQSDFFVN